MVVSQDANPLPVIIADQATVCSNISYMDSHGVQKTGTKSCDCTASNQQGCVANARYQTVDTQSFTDADIKTGSTVAGVAGSCSGAFSNCAADGDSVCLVDGPTFKAVAVANLLVGNIKSGVQIGGVTGTFTGSYSNCSTAGEQSCIAAAPYFSGTVCGVDGSNCFLPLYSVPGNQFKKAIDYSTIDATKMLSTLTISGVRGTYSTPSACTLDSNGGSSCVLAANDVNNQPLWPTFAEGGDPVVYGSTVNLQLANSGASPQDFATNPSAVSYRYDAFTYDFKANETKWFKFNYSNPQAAPQVDIVMFSRNFTSVRPDFDFTAAIYDGDLKMDANYTVASRINAGWFSLGRASSTTAFTQYIKVANGATAQTIKIMLFGYNYH